MRGMVQWAIKNSPAMNMMMIAVLAVGTFSLMIMHREVFPYFDLEIVLVNVPYPGASPEEVEQGVCQKIEEATRTIDGIKKMTSIAKEGSGSVVLELRGDVDDVQKVVADVRSEVDRIPSFPDLAEDVEVQQITMRWPAIKIGILAPENDEHADERQLRAVAEKVRDELLQLKEVSQVKLQGARAYQVDIEVNEDTLRKYGLTLQELARIVRRENLEMPGGTMRSESQEVLLRGKNKRLDGMEIAKLPVLTDPNGVVLNVGDLGTVRDEFADTTAVSVVNGRRALVLSVERTESEDLLALTKAIRAYTADTELPGGYTLTTWRDMSVDVKDRLDMLIKNGLMGLVLVFIVLAVFLELRLAFWVALGIPVALLGAGGILLLGGQTLNMLSMFAFLMALGIVVDDAIVVGENIYAHRQMGKGYVRAAIDGTVEVVPSVVASVTTTIVAFGPMLFVTGVMGKFIAVMPIAVIAMLVLSLWESTFVLPCHLAHRDSLLFRIIGVLFYPFRFIVTMFAASNRGMTRCLGFLIERTYLPTLRWSLQYRWTVVAAAAALLMITIGFVQAGLVPFVIFPKLDGNNIEAKVVFPDGTPAAVTAQATQRIEDALMQVDEAYQREGAPPVVVLVHSALGASLDTGNPAMAGISSGSHVGHIEVQLADTAHREVTSQDIIDRWRKVTEDAGGISGVESLSFGAPSMGPAGRAIEFKLLSSMAQFGELEAAVELAKAKLATYQGVKDIDDDSRPGKWEFQIRVKDQAQAMGVTTADLAETIRASYYGEEVMRLQRGRHEVKLMVRYPQEDRRSPSDFHDIRVRTGDGQERMLTDLADIQVVRGYSEINRVDQMRSITIYADIEEGTTNARTVTEDMAKAFMPGLLESYPGVKVRWEGQKEQTSESVGSLMMGTAVALLIMYFLLTLEFRSYLQPLLILVIIPFGIIGAIFGHALMGLDLTLFSFFGLVALTGVVVNDSIVLVDFINHRVRDGVPINEALIDAGRRRFRPVLLTSITTVAGLLPILLETSFQAQVLIPMATSLSFGLLLATALVLVMLPACYRIYHDWFPYQAPAEEDHDEPVESAEPHLMSEELPPLEEVAETVPNLALRAVD